MSGRMHGRSRTKSSGNGKRVSKFRDKRRSEIGNFPAETKMGASKGISSIRRRGGSITAKLKRAAEVNLLTKDGYKKMAIKGVLESKDNKNFARLNIITKGTIINTDLGKAVVLNRVGRDGTINARLLEQQ
ncbi:MAG: 30S ribosomal protein S8e [Candidatus Marsarchaeota archaeon]|jgi:small subunit ribosomal protein S8e|nr:30S ribosomal protein S8e [Candidatus Marsarchaeota archaeon]MCL5112683.1 30S ribosomal protein S8e [Candidatus Marsarchaeota archaeon]